MCGRRDNRRKYIYPTEIPTLPEEEKVFRELEDGRILHDRTKLKIPKSIIKKFGKILKSENVRMVEKKIALKSIIQ